jgi:hypothetical protein
MTTPLDYPLPQHAAYIWTNGDKILLTFPGYEGVESRRFNTVTLDPKTPAETIAVLWSVLRERANASRQDRRIASRAAPTQAQLDEMIKHMKVNRIEPKKDVSDLDTDQILEELGL